MTNTANITLADLSIALVEPSHTQQRIIGNHLRSMGITKITMFQDAQTALDGLHRDVPDLIISAMHLPDRTGTELAEALREDPVTMDVLFMLVSSETAYRYLEPLKQAGVVAILPKPFHPDALRKALNTTLDFLLPDQELLDEGTMDGMRVLVVDDSVTARHHIQRVLHNMGIDNVVQVASGRDAIEEVKNNFFDLIVTDYNMPEIDGRQLAQFVREKSSQRSVPILMVTSERDNSRLAQVQQSGVSAICDKPFEPSSIKSLVRKLLAGD